MDHLYLIYQLDVLILHCYVSLPEGIFPLTTVHPLLLIVFLRSSLINHYWPFSTRDGLWHERWVVVPGIFQFDLLWFHILMKKSTTASRSSWDRSSSRIFCTLPETPFTETLSLVLCVVESTAPPCSTCQPLLYGPQKTDFINYPLLDYYIKLEPLEILEIQSISNHWSNSGCTWMGVNAWACKKATVGLPYRQVPRGGDTNPINTYRNMIMCDFTPGSLTLNFWLILQKCSSHISPYNYNGLFPYRWDISFVGGILIIYSRIFP